MSSQGSNLGVRPTNERDVIYSQIRLQQDQHLQQGNRRCQAGIPVGEQILRGVLAEKRSRSRESHFGIYPTSSFREAYRARPSSTVLRAFTSKNYQIANEPTHNMTVDGTDRTPNVFEIDIRVVSESFSYAAFRSKSNSTPIDRMERMKRANDERMSPIRFIECSDL
ncbi:hypothetical protein KEM48_009639 [Puccinia striiformis f. sp. tritici PST-130]|nr:hypothetical protein KEM48_009639 [Puccinia striiformis f. sp. tritici PST-130]